MKKLIIIALMLIVPLSALADWTDDQPATTGISLQKGHEYTKDNLAHLQGVIEGIGMYLDGANGWKPGWDDADPTTFAISVPWAVVTTDPTGTISFTEGFTYWDSDSDALKIYDTTTGSFLSFSTGATAGVDGVRTAHTYSTPYYSYQEDYIDLIPNVSSGISMTQNTVGNRTAITATYLYGTRRDIPYGVVNLDDTTPAEVAWNTSDSGRPKERVIDFGMSGTKLINLGFIVPSDVDSVNYPIYIDCIVSPATHTSGSTTGMCSRLTMSYATYSYTGKAEEAAGAVDQATPTCASTWVSRGIVSALSKATWLMPLTITANVVDPLSRVYLTIGRTYNGSLDNLKGSLRLHDIAIHGTAKRGGASE